MAQSPKGSLVHGFYNPIHGNRAIYFYPGVNSRIDSQWNFSNGYSSTWSKLSNTTQNVAKKTAVSRRGNHPSIPPFVDTCVHAICVHVSNVGWDQTMQKDRGLTKNTESNAIWMIAKPCRTSGDAVILLFIFGVPHILTLLYMHRYLLTCCI